MQKTITYENLRQFAYSNDRLIKGEIKGIVIRFSGLGVTATYGLDPGDPLGYPGDALEYAEAGIIYLLPYYDPWCWMNRGAVRFVDELIDALLDKYGIAPDAARIVSTGRSMGGLCALIYSAYAKIKPISCLAICPVCDLPYHSTERGDVLRTVYAAFADYGCSLDEAMKSCSPLHVVDKLPQITYRIFACEKDVDVSPQRHSLAFYEAMRPMHDITLVSVPLRGHCELSLEAHLAFRNYIFEALDK